MSYVAQCRLGCASVGQLDAACGRQQDASSGLTSITNGEFVDFELTCPLLLSGLAIVEPAHDVSCCEPLPVGDVTELWGVDVDTVFD